MKENLMNSAHKATNDTYRDNYDRIFGKKEPKIEIKYTVRYPNRCAGQLTIVIDGEEWVFPPFPLASGGYVDFDSVANKPFSEVTPEEIEDVVHYGPWEIKFWPPGFPEEMKPIVEDMVNKQIPWGCCGGCLLQAFGISEEDMWKKFDMEI